MTWTLPSFPVIYSDVGMHLDTGNFASFVNPVVQTTTSATFELPTQVNGEAVTGAVLNISLEGPQGERIHVNYLFQDGGGGQSFTCDYESGFDEQANRPVIFNSFHDFETVVAACGGALPQTDAGIIGTWTLGTEAETGVFHVDHTVTVGGENFNWEILPDNLLQVTDGRTNFLFIKAFTPNGQKAYEEDVTWGSDLTTLDGAKEGEIFTWPPLVKQ